MRKLEETLSVLRRANPRNQPSIEDIARLHELHARHERERGREAAAVVAEERARIRAREPLTLSQIQSRVKATPEQGDASRAEVSL